jgi:hypothetical protein
MSELLSDKCFPNCSRSTRGPKMPLQRTGTRTRVGEYAQRGSFQPLNGGVRWIINISRISNDLPHRD